VLSMLTLYQLTLSAIGDGDLAARFARLGSERLDLLDGFQAFDDVSEDDVLSVQPRGFGGAQEKLGAVRVGSGVGHRQNTWASVLQLEVLVLELVAVDGLAPGSVVVGEVATLAHEVGDDTVERRALEPVALLAGAKATEVLGRLGDHVRAELHDDPSDRLVAGGDIEIASWEGHDG